MEKNDEYDDLEYAFKEFAIAIAEEHGIDVQTFFKGLVDASCNADVMRWHWLMGETFRKLTSGEICGNSCNSCLVNHEFTWNPDGNSEAMKNLFNMMLDDPVPMFRRILFSHFQEGVHAEDELNDDR